MLHKFTVYLSGNKHILRICTLYPVLVSMQCKVISEATILVYTPTTDSFADRLHRCTLQLLVHMPIYQTWLDRNRISSGYIAFRMRQYANDSRGHGHLWHTAGEAMATLYRRCDLNTSVSLSRIAICANRAFRTMQYKHIVQIRTP